MQGQPLRIATQVAILNFSARKRAQCLLKSKPVQTLQEPRLLLVCYIIAVLSGALRSGGTPRLSGKIELKSSTFTHAPWQSYNRAQLRPSHNLAKPCNKRAATAHCFKVAGTTVVPGNAT